MIATQNRSTTAQLDYGRPWTQRDTLLFGAELSRLKGLSSPVQANKQGRCEDEKLVFFFLYETIQLSLTNIFTLIYDAV